jgi:hypothetical protein
LIMMQKFKEAGINPFKNYLLIHNFISPALGGTDFLKLFYGSSFRSISSGC